MNVLDVGLLMSGLAMAIYCARSNSIQVRTKTLNIYGDLQAIVGAIYFVMHPLQRDHYWGIEPYVPICLGMVGASVGLRCMQEARMQNALCAFGLSFAFAAAGVLLLLNMPKYAVAAFVLGLAVVALTIVSEGAWATPGAKTRKVRK